MVERSMNRPRTAADNAKRVVFVGQAPSCDSSPSEPLSGRCATVMAELLGVSPAAFLLMNRLNLNPLFAGKDGKGDAFNPVVGQMIAHTLLSVSGFDRFVLLGSHVARCFGLPWDELCVYDRGDRQFLILPHPSGINTYWNDPTSKTKAAARLRRFVFEAI